MALNTEQMRVDHSSLIRQNQLRQADLERENAELTASLTSQQKEILRLQHSTSSSSHHSLNSNMDYIALQQELTSLTAKYEAIVDLNEENERKLKLLERENRASSMNFEDEKRRNLATIDELALKVTDLENKLAARSKQGGAGGVGGSGGFLFSSASVDAGDDMERHGGQKEGEWLQFRCRNLIEISLSSRYDQFCEFTSTFPFLFVCRPLPRCAEHGLRHTLPGTAGAPVAVAEPEQATAEEAGGRAGAAGREERPQEQTGGHADQVCVCVWV